MGPPTYVPALDGLRAIAVLLVLQHHIGIPGVTGGFIGVSIFFVLSGFLITRILLQQFEERNRLGIAHFYARRALRLYPALVAGVALGVALSEATGSFVPQTRHGAPLALSYLLNFDSWLGTARSGLVGHLWSLATEVHFYLLWPLMLLMVLRSQSPAVRPMGLAVAGLFACWALSLAHMVLTARATYYFPVFGGLPLMGGCALAIALRAGSPSWVKRRPAVLAAIAVLAVTAIWAQSTPDWMFLAGFPAVFAAAAYVVGFTVAEPRSRLSRVLSTRALLWLGVRSYGIYLYHYPFALAFRTYDTLPRAVAVTGCTLAAAATSWAVLERPILRRGSGVRGREVEAAHVPVQVPT